MEIIIHEKYNDQKQRKLQSASDGYSPQKSGGSQPDDAEEDL